MEAVLPPQPWQGAGHHQRSSAEPALMPAEALVVVDLRRSAVFGHTTALHYRRKALAGAVNLARLIAERVC